MTNSLRSGCNIAELCNNQKGDHKIHAHGHPLILCSVIVLLRGAKVTYDSTPNDRKKRGAKCCK